MELQEIYKSQCKRRVTPAKSALRELPLGLLIRF